MSNKDEHTIETYKSLISISTQAFSALQFLNGGAAVALLAYLGQMAPTHPELLNHGKIPLAFFVAGLVAGTLVYATSYLTQFSLYNEDKGKIKYGKHKFWLCISVVLRLSSVVLLSLGAFFVFTLYLQ